MINWSRVHVVLAVPFLVVAALIVLPSFASAKPVQKKVGATIIYKTPTNPENATNCGVVPLIQWKDPTENRFVGSSWEGHYFFLGKEEVVRPVPPFHNKFTWLGVDFFATGGNNWWMPGDGTWRVGGTSDEASAACAEYLTKAQQQYGSQAWVIVTGEEDKSDTAKCIKARQAYTKANRKVRTARKTLRNAKSPTAKARARTRLNSAIEARTRATSAQGKACNG